MASFTGKPRGRRTAKTGLPASVPVNSPAGDLWTRAPAEARIGGYPAVSSPLLDPTA